MSKRKGKRRDTSRTGLPKLIGLMLVVTAIINIPYSIYLAMTPDQGNGLVPGIGDLGEQVAMYTAAIVIMMSIVTLIGGYYSFRRSKWTISLVGGICAALGTGPYCLSTMVAIVAILFLFVAKDEYVD